MYASGARASSLVALIHTHFMRTTKFIGSIGFLVAVIPLIGLPRFWKTSILVTLGIVLLGFALWRYYTSRKSIEPDPRDQIVTDSYVENSPATIMKHNAVHNGRPKV